ncbi:MAG TPA: DUF5947 family protein [Solirubrobacter sp.]|nr:DUF5947 family protein [Solirubrobacter sp.]
MSALTRLARPATLERCELCGTPIAADHRHVLALDTREVKCACRPCGLLFERAERMRLIPTDVTRVAPPAVELPVDTVFFVRTSGAVRAYYPSPAGATESLLDVDVDVAFADDVEALLVNRARGAWIVPIDACYALVGLMRTHWRGITGGADVWRELDRFYDGLDERS